MSSGSGLRSDPGPIYARRGVKAYLTAGLVGLTLLLGGTVAAAGAAGPPAAASAKKKPARSKGKAPAKCRKLRGTRAKRCAARAKRCPRGHVKTYNRRRTVARCNRRPATPKPPGAPTPSFAPIDYMQIQGLSAVEFATDAIERVPLELASHDGINLYVEVIRPKAPGRYPVILEASGYHGTLYDRDGDRILPDPTGPDGKPLGLVGFFVPRGYAVVMVDLRGTGRSEGCLDHLGPNDVADIKTAIEWAASQPWSNGRVAMTGHSYVGGTTNLGGASGAKGLATIVPSASLASIYDHQFQAGVPYNAQYAGPTAGYTTLALAADLPPGLPLEAVAGPTGDNFGNDPQYTACSFDHTAALSGSGQVTGQYEAYHAERDYRAGVRDAKIPIFLQHGTIDEAARIAGVQWMFERGLPAGDKLWVGPWDHGIDVAPTRRGLQWPHALLAWFDKHLKGKAVDTGPPLEVFINDEPHHALSRSAQGQILSGPRLPQTRPFVLFARADEGLDAQPGDAGTVSFVGDSMGYAQDNDAAGGVTFESAPLTEDRLFFGIPQLHLKAATTDPQTHLIGTLFVGKRRLTQCAMNPILKDGIDKLATIVPQQLYELDPPCFAMAFHARKGQQLRLRITTSDPDKLPLHSADPNVAVAFGAEGGTRIELPEVAVPTFADTIPLGNATGDPNAGA